MAIEPSTAALLLLQCWGLLRGTSKGVSTDVPLLQRGCDTSGAEGFLREGSPVFGRGFTALPALLTVMLECSSENNNRKNNLQYEPLPQSRHDMEPSKHSIQACLFTVLSIICPYIIALFFHSLLTVYYILVFFPVLFTHCFRPDVTHLDHTSYLPVTLSFFY